ncbi:MAG: hypothetical protein JXA41_03070 [Deltaproteobacteria bacterium]|nr:hypothetical protein [Deltaproteobacteria bacterium]
MIAHVNAVIRIGIGTIGLFVGYYRLFHDRLDEALDITVLTTVALAGLLSFAGHFLFHKSDALRLLRESENFFYQYEVGFAHLAFAATAYLVHVGPWGLEAKILVVLGYSLFILQTAVLYAWRCHVEHHVFSRYFLRHALFTIVYVGLMLNFVSEALYRAEISLF